MGQVADLRSQVQFLRNKVWHMWFQTALAAINTIGLIVILWKLFGG